MATADSVKAKLEALIAKANETTGNVESDLTTAVNALVAGFGGGVRFETGSFVTASGTYTQSITHALNSKKVLVIWSIHESMAYYNRYTAVMGFAVSNGFFPTRIIDVSSYNTAGLSETEFSPNTVHTVMDMISAYTNSKNPICTYPQYIINDDPNTFTIKTREGFFIGHQYDWVAIDISGASMPWEQEGV